MDGNREDRAARIERETRAGVSHHRGDDVRWLLEERERLLRALRAACLWLPTVEMIDRPEPRAQIAAVWAALPPDEARKALGEGAR